MNITEKVKSFEDACAVLGIVSALPNLTGISEKHQKAILAHYKLVIIAEALNEGWIPNWDNDDEWKYYPWFVMGSASGVGFSYHDCGTWRSASSVGSRLCFKSRDLARYAGEHFEELYKDYFVLS